MGILRIRGTIDINQFWPINESDADTTKLRLIVGKKSFEYKEDGKTKFVTTSVFEGAISKGAVTNEVINISKKEGTRSITVRLQGIDAPELHYKAASLKKSINVSDAQRKKFNKINKERRQPFAESATVALANHLKKYADSSGLIKSTFESIIQYPYEVVDTYGRFIGNISVGKGHDINLWLVRNGWGQPAFYTSMLPEEIQAFLKAWNKGKKIKDRTASASVKDAGNFDWDLLYRKPPFTGSFTIGEDKGEVLMPKIYRRQVAWLVSKKAGIPGSKANFKTYMENNKDQAVLLNEFLEKGIHASEVFYLRDIISDDDKVLKGAEEIAFKEKAGTMVNAHGKEIKKW